jgi:hypothetical protein
MRSQKDTPNKSSQPGWGIRPKEFLTGWWNVLTGRPPHTKTVTVGTSVLDIPYHNPVMLARRLTTLDHLSNGRVRLGLGLGWSKDEMDAAVRLTAPTLRQ